MDFIHAAELERFAPAGGVELFETELRMRVQVTAQSRQVTGWNRAICSNARPNALQASRLRVPASVPSPPAAQARVNREVQQVHDQADHHEDERNQAEVGGHHGDVGKRHSLDEQQAHARPLEYRPVMMAKAIRPPSCRPVMVMTGTSVFLSAWPKWMARDWTGPRARANLM